MGYCTQPKIADGDFSHADKLDMLVYDYEEGGGFKVGENFGCVHWEPSEKHNKIEVVKRNYFKVYEKIPSEKDIEYGLQLIESGERLEQLLSRVPMQKIEIKNDD